MVVQYPDWRIPRLLEGLVIVIYKAGRVRLRDLGCLRVCERSGQVNDSGRANRGKKELFLSELNLALNVSLLMKTLKRKVCFAKSEHEDTVFCWR